MSKNYEMSGASEMSNSNEILIVAVDQDEAQRAKPLVKPFHSASPLEVSLTSYPMQPWTNKNVDLKQWFNYGFNPSTWSKYCIEEMAKSQQSSSK